MMIILNNWEHDNKCSRIFVAQDGTKCSNDDKVQEIKSVERAVAAVTANSKRAKNKKRREVQQEFTHSWIVGTLKGHTGPVLEMDFSSDDKFLASCAEDCSRFRRQRQRGSIEIGVAEYQNDIDRTSTTGTTGSDVTDDSPSSPDSSNVPKSSQTVKTLINTDENLSNASGSSSPAMTDADFINLTRRQRKNRRSSRESTHCRDSNESTEDCIRTRRIWHRSHEGTSSKLVYQHKQRRNVQPPSMTRACTNQGSNLANQNVQKPEKKKSPTDPPQSSYNMIAKADNQLIILHVNLNTSINGAYNVESFDNYESVTDNLLREALPHYVIHPYHLVHLGYPVLGGGAGKLAFFLRESHFPHPPRPQRTHHQLDANAQEFVPKRRRAPENTEDGNEASTTTVVPPTPQGEEVVAALPSSQQRSDRDNDSGRGSAENSDLDGESSSDSEKTSDTNESNSWLPSSSSSTSSSPPPSLVSTSIKERECARCYKPFLTDNNGDYITKDPCLHHWGKKRWNEIDRRRYYTCCNRFEFSSGCTVAPRHVWSGAHIGCNGPFEGFVVTQPAKVPLFKIYALDCEMCYTKFGLELTKVTVIGLDGEIVYNTYVKPHNEIIDYNTRFSGITADHLKNCTTTLQDVQARLLTFITTETILMGHALENDLRVLKIVHPTIVDTCHAFDNTGNMLKTSLKMLAQTKLGRQIQVAEHDSVEDAKTVIDLMRYQVWEDFYKAPEKPVEFNSVRSVV
ncbi:uncharacterized protein prage isoform X2 [Chelonus insularis]|uniref:uncharacterized protein prage isoform X2 n=1 Tax=Chelonus insularis TaxID=460826 RepID=UPI00158B6D17|nr:uncharacterized protein LOC118073123 isoform X2 [Chelonus insularis]